MRLSPAAASVPLLLVLLTWLAVHGIEADAPLYEHALTALDDFALTQSALHRDVLRARAGLLRNYDPLVAEATALDGLIGQLHGIAAIDERGATAVGALAGFLSREEALTEEFKTDNALLQNSLAYFGMFSTRLGKENGPLPLAVGDLAVAIFHLTLDTSPAAVRQVDERLAKLAIDRGQSGDAEALDGLLAHGRLLNDLLPRTDALVTELFGVPSVSQSQAIRAIVTERQRASASTARRYRLGLYVASLLLLAVLVHLALRLRARARSLRQRAAVEHELATFSTNVINSTAHGVGLHIERTLQHLAALLEADRAYFVLSSPAPRVHGWCRAGVRFAPGWPDEALRLAGRVSIAADGVVHVRQIGRLRARPDRDTLAAAGLHSWICIARLDGPGMASTLGFDALRPGPMAQAVELGWLPMALDAIANAVSRTQFEQERGRLEARLEQARRLETVGALASGIAHNLNNIVGAILGYVEMAEAETAPNSRTARSLDEIRRAGARATALVDQIMDFGRQRDAHRERVNLRSLLTEAASLLRASLPERYRVAVGDVPQEAAVFGSAAQLQQVIINLCNNAAHAMDDGGEIAIDVALCELAGRRSVSHGELAPGRYVSLAVNDTGHGMDEATLARVFEPFFTTRSTGHGLGLATVRDIVREHGGALHVESTAGQGSRFEAWLPAAAAARSSPEDTRRAVPLGRGETVLVVDEDRTRVVHDEELLAALGYEAIGFTNGEAALAAFRSQPSRYDAILVVRLVPAAAAFELAGAVRTMAPALPILLATESADEIAADALLAAGIGEVVHRPLASAEIAAALGRALSARM